MEIVKKKLEVTIYGQKFELGLPSALKMAEFEEEIKANVSSAAQIKIIHSFLVKMGLPIEICEDLDVDSLKSLLEFITDKKK